MSNACLSLSVRRRSEKLQMTHFARDRPLSRKDWYNILKYEYVYNDTENAKVSTVETPRADRFSPSLSSPPSTTDKNQLNQHQHFLLIISTINRICSLYFPLIPYQWICTFPFQKYTSLLIYFHFTRTCNYFCLEINYIINK